MKEEQKGEMKGNNTHHFTVVNLTNGLLKGTVSWHGGSDRVSIDVKELAPGKASELKQFNPRGGVNDLWSWSERGREYQLNCYDGDTYAVVTISNYGIGVLVTDTSPDTWKW